jgi:dihydrofolate reductase
MIRFIAAIDNKRGLANDQGIPWNLPTDKKYFADETKNGTIIMGFRTYEEFDKPLGGRKNFVVDNTNSDLRSGFQSINNVGEFLNQHGELVWIIGGAGLFGQTINFADELYITQLNSDFNCTKFFPEYSADFELLSSSDSIAENDITFRFEIWKRKVSRE